MSAVRILTCLVLILLPRHLQARRFTQVADILKLENPVFVNSVNRLRVNFDPVKNKFPGKIKFLQFIYATPLERDEFGNYTSSILDDFSYKKIKKRITFKLKDGLTFSDGTPITVHDLAFSILRMMYLTPDYPVLKDIRGAREWHAREAPLEHYPSGFKIKKNKLSITLKNHIKTPFFGFAHSFYSVVPARCFNKTNGNLICDYPPASGKYVLEPPGKTSYFRFKKRSHVAKDLPEYIWYVHISARVLFKYLPLLKKNTVVMLNSIDLPPGHIQLLSQNMHRYMFPAARTLSILLNSNTMVLPLRQFLASEFRKTIKKEGHQMTGSFFPAILPGFRSLSQLQFGKTELFSREERNRMISYLQSNPPILLQQDLDQFDTFWDICHRTFQRLRINFRVEKNRGRADFVSLWNQGKVWISLVYRGFWPENPYYDFIDLTSSQILPKTGFLIRYPAIKEALNDSELFQHPKNLLEINQLIFDNAEMASVAHYSRFYFSSHKVKHFLPYGKTTPYIWNFFRNK